MEKEKAIQFIVEMLKTSDDSDKLFLIQICTLVKKHFEKKGKR